MHVAKGASAHTEFAPDTLIRVDLDSIEYIPRNSAGRANIHTGGVFALHTHDRYSGGSLLHIKCDYIDRVMRANGFTGPAVFTFFGGNH